MEEKECIYLKTYYHGFYANAIFSHRCNNDHCTICGLIVDPTITCTTCKNRKEREA